MGVAVLHGIWHIVTHRILLPPAISPLEDLQQYLKGEALMPKKRRI